MKSAGKHSFLQFSFLVDTNLPKQIKYEVAESELFQYFSSVISNRTELELLFHFCDVFHTFELFLK